MHAVRLVQVSRCKPATRSRMERSCSSGLNLFVSSRSLVFPEKVGAVEILQNEDVVGDLREIMKPVSNSSQTGLVYSPPSLHLVSGIVLAKPFERIDCCNDYMSNIFGQQYHLPLMSATLEQQRAKGEVALPPTFVEGFHDPDYVKRMTYRSVHSFRGLERTLRAIARRQMYLIFRYRSSVSLSIDPWVKREWLCRPWALELQPSLRYMVKLSEFKPSSVVGPCH